MKSNLDADTEPPANRGGSRSLLMWSALALLAGGLLVYLLFFAPRHETHVGTSHPAVRSRLTSLSLEPLTGTKQRVRLEDLQGKVVLVNYWGTWCGPCHMEFPQLVLLEKQLRKETDFRFLSVSCGHSPDEEDPSELERNTKAFLGKAKADIPTYLDAGGISRRALVDAADLKGFNYPTTVLLDRQGAIRALWLGYAEIFDREIDLAVHKVLAER